VPAGARGGLGAGGTAPALVSTSQTLDTVDQQFVVTLKPGADAAQIASEYGAVLLDVQENVAVMEPLPGESTTLLDVQASVRNDTRVLSSEENALAMPAEARQKSWAFDDGYGSYRACLGQSSFSRMGLAAAQTVSQGAGVLVAVLDTGIDPRHPLFAGRIAGGKDFIDDDDDPTDVANGIDEDHDGVADGAYGHGTHVAGIIALTAPRARLLIARVLDAEGRGDVKSVAAGIRWAVGHGARVINLSLGLLTNSNAVRIAISEAQAQGIVCVAAAGNSGAEFPLEYPAANNQTIAVAAVDADDRPASFTSYGTYVDMCAPGVNIRSAYPGGGYALWSGTSMAAPAVSGTVALLLSLHPSWNAGIVLARLWMSARPTATMTVAQTGRLGGGVIDANYALADDRPASGPIDLRYLATGSPQAP
jgi:subtilisin family serine protease